MVVSGSLEIVNIKLNILKNMWKMAEYNEDF
jgi:hypothetical protein